VRRAPASATRHANDEAQHLFDIKRVAFTRILMDQGGAVLDTLNGGRRNPDQATRH